MARLLVLLAGLCGVGAFVMPLFTVQVTEGDASLAVSTLNILQGAESLRDRVKGTDVKMTDAQVDDMDEGLQKAKTTFLLLVGGPGALLLLFALLGMGRFGRGLALLSLLVGLAGVGCWALLRTALDEAAKKGDGYTTTPGLAVTLLLATGALGALGGLIGLLRPERPAPPA